jgi:hypothetical protein
MFIQVIHGKAKDKEGLLRRWDNWRDEMMPQSVGFIGSTAGVADDGTAIMAARFESEEEARKNSDSDAQSQWWEETRKYFDGDPKFYDYTNIETDRDGGSDDAGFVQFIIGRVSDINEARNLMDSVQGSTSRPDLIGSVTGWGEDGHFTTAAYFTSEEEARKGEASEPSSEEAEVMEKWRELMQEVAYVDLRNPRFLTK